jgi:hypothetical protein
MGKAKYSQSLALAAMIVAALAAGAVAQPDKDLTVTGINIEVAKGDFRIIPEIAIHSTGNDNDFPLEIGVAFDGTLAHVMVDIVHYVVATSTCYNYVYPDCGMGDCLTIYGFFAYVDGVCDRRLAAPNLCGCIWVLYPESPWFISLGQQTCTIIVDPNDLVTELDETNNELTIELGPVASEPQSWSSVKALYR